MSVLYRQRPNCFMGKCCARWCSFACTFTAYECTKWSSSHTANLGEMYKVGAKYMQIIVVPNKLIPSHRLYFTFLTKKIILP